MKNTKLLSRRAIRALEEQVIIHQQLVEEHQNQVSILESAVAVLRNERVPDDAGTTIRRYHKGRGRRIMTAKERHLISVRMKAAWKRRKAAAKANDSIKRRAAKARKNKDTAGQNQGAAKAA